AELHLGHAREGSLLGEVLVRLRDGGLHVLLRLVAHGRGRSRFFRDRAAGLRQRKRRSGGDHTECVERLFHCPAPFEWTTRDGASLRPRDRRATPTPSHGGTAAAPSSADRHGRSRTSRARGGGDMKPNLFVPAAMLVALSFMGTSEAQQSKASAKK